MRRLPLTESAAPTPAPQMLSAALSLPGSALQAHQSPRDLPSLASSMSCETSLSPSQETVDMESEDLFTSSHSSSIGWHRYPGGVQGLRAELLSVSLAWSLKPKPPQAVHQLLAGTQGLTEVTAQDVTGSVTLKK